MYSNCCGIDNTALGFESLFSNTTGNYNTAIGFQSLYLNLSGYKNVAVGQSSLRTNSSGYNNTAVGYESLYDNISGISNTAVGYWSLANNTNGNDNTTVGFKSLYWNFDGDRNTAIGFDALNKNAGGNNNVAVGHHGLFENQSGSQRTAIGKSANSIDNDFSNNTGLGYNAACLTGNTVRVGNSSVVSIGGYANWTNVSDLRFKTNIAEDVQGLDFIQKLRPVTYHLDLHSIERFFEEHYGEMDDTEWEGKYDKNDIQYSGFIAQEVEQAALELGYDFSGVDQPKNEDDFYGLRYAEFVVPLVKAVQEQQEIIELLLTKIATQESENAMQESENVNMRSELENIKIALTTAGITIN